MALMVKRVSIKPLEVAKQCRGLILVVSPRSATSFWFSAKCPLWGWFNFLGSFSGCLFFSSVFWNDILIVIIHSTGSFCFKISLGNMGQSIIHRSLTFSMAYHSWGGVK